MAFNFKAIKYRKLNCFPVNIEHERKFSITYNLKIIINFLTVCTNLMKKVSDSNADV